MNKKSLLIVYTGNGKGKTTAAFGLALRALGHSKKISIIQFVKSKKSSGELSIEDKWKDLVEVRVTGSGFMMSENEAKKRENEALSGWEIAKKNILSGNFFIVILDELTYILEYGLIEKDEVLQCISGRPAGTHVVITGRKAPQWLVSEADIVTEMTEVKHSYSSGTKAQEGIEW
jgi:cob(I)alamin adenosyltransferase